jgi:hypothetical protein
MTESLIRIALLSVTASLVLLAVVVIWIGRSLVHEMRALRDIFKGVEARLRGVEDAMTGVQKDVHSSVHRDWTE